MEQNWAGNHTYVAEQVLRPTSVEELGELVAGQDRVRALGSRHAFTDLADTTGTLVATDALPGPVEVDPARRLARVGAGLRYGELADRLAAEGWALATMASLPHISVAGAIATGTHGSGDRTGSLAAAVAGLEYVAADGSLVRVGRGEPDFAGSVVALGALGVVTAVTLDVEPAYDVRQDVYVDLPWDAAVEGLDELTGAAYSVSLFTDWVSGRIQQVWLKSRGDQAPADPLGARPATATMHMLAGADVEAVTRQLGVPGPWHRRLPHFRMEFTPSRGEELQSEYLLPREQAREAVARLRELAPRFASLLQVSEVRTIAADDLWLSGAHGRDTVGLHFTWVRDVPGVYAVLPAIEAALLPLGGRPHWGKCFAATAADLRPLYPRYDDFRDLVARVDPAGRFRNDYLVRCLDLP
ncbi:D-arabinono-1,4-lactone oxidase [Nocardioides mangrovi]|uniref:FAD-binding protein n=1 Tax=Nocardioides mangrovi TaxID=2874580 RepID=A0ABS7UC33_9ACTN|nr:D-arabinono-1,4-lactone oxidase [Nocardioides mangrovi]MBZ5738223.1 FAD-binding protein [Nocardioides mangrovi]